MTTDAKPLDLAAIRARADAATEGPWESGQEIDGVYAGRRTVVRATSGKRLLSVGQTRGHDAERAEANAAFAAHAREDIPALLAEVERLRELVGDESQPGWEGCSRAEAIRQAESFHASVMEWKRDHDARRDERDQARAEVERLHELRDAAVAWRAQFGKPAESKPPRMATLITAVDKLTEGSGR